MARHFRREMETLLNAYQPNPDDLADVAIKVLASLGQAKGAPDEDILLAFGISSEARNVDLLPADRAGIHQYPSPERCPAVLAAKINYQARREVFTKHQLRQIAHWSFALPLPAGEDEDSGG